MVKSSGILHIQTKDESHKIHKHIFTLEPKSLQVNILTTGRKSFSIVILVLNLVGCLDIPETFI